jgi:FtsP/CotA-like multicopper oxidase with cupredoxin domain/plastocyanin
MDKHIWIQLENHAWDLAPNNVDRMTGQKVNESPQSFTLTSPETSFSRIQSMYKPIENALLLRRYNENWEKPQDQKVNPWDLNERDPTDNGTMGTIPGPVIECNVGDKVIVHFSNKDNRKNVTKLNRLHSLHTHGFVFNIVHDGAYPLSPPDPNQPVGDELDLWKDINVPPPSDFKRGDRVPPGGTFTYTWNTFGWPTTAGVWLYHDHSIDDMTNVQLGAIGIVVIHNPDDAENDVFNPDLPGGSNIGSPLDQVVFRTPPTNARYLVLLHEVQGGYMCINGRWKLGNAPTFVAGLTTKMRFGIVAMGDMAHTFHIHGHRWVIDGPDGIHAGDIERSIQNRSVSQFEDTRIMGAANSFNFTIRQGSFMGSLFSVDPTQAPGLGEWHTHCHIPGHMMNGMMGSLLIVNQGTPIKGLLQYGVAHVEHDGGHAPATVTVDHVAFVGADGSNELTVPSGTEVTFDFREANHTVVTVSSTNADPISINNGGGDTDAVSPVPQTRVVTITGNGGGEIRYQCGIHGSMMPGVIHISNNGGHVGGHGGGH